MCQKNNVCPYLHFNLCQIKWFIVSKYFTFPYSYTYVPTSQSISFTACAAGESVTVASASKDQTVRLWKVIGLKNCLKCW